MEWVTGVKLTTLPQDEIKALARVGQEAFLTQLLEIGFFHGARVLRVYRSSSFSAPGGCRRGESKCGTIERGGSPVRCPIHSRKRRHMCRKPASAMRAVASGSTRGDGDAHSVLCRL